MTAEIKSNTHPAPSVLVLTRNEEVNIDACLRRLSFSDDVVVLDGGSTDRTVEIAGTFPNVRVVHREFDDEHSQRNYALHDIEYSQPWLYISNADELLDEGLATEIARVMNEPDQPHVAFRLRCKRMYMGKWIKRAAGYPTWKIRLVQPQHVRYEMQRTDPVVDGSIGQLQGHFIHRGLDTGLRRWFDEQNFASGHDSLEAVSPPQGQGSRSARLRAFRRFFSMYLMRGGILEGIPGFHYCAISAMFEYWVELKTAERSASWREATDALAEKMLSEARP